MQADKESVVAVKPSIAIMETCIRNRSLTENMSNLVRSGQKDLANVNAIC